MDASNELNSPILPPELQLAAFVVFLCILVTIITMLSVFWLLSNLYDKGVFDDAPIIIGDKDPADLPTKGTPAGELAGEA